MPDNTTYILVDTSCLKISSEALEKSIKENLNKEYFTYHIEYFNSSLEAAQRAGELAEQLVPYLIACGGNQTINAVASRLVNTESTLGIIPQGLVNGLAAHLNINNFLVDDAMRTLNRRTVKQIDSALLNEHFMVNIAGLGFDAEIAAEVNAGGYKKGPSLAWMVLKKYFASRSFPLRVTYESGELYTRVFWVAVTNGKQYGTRLYLNPRASLSDGMVEVCLIKKPTFIELPFFLINMFRKREFPAFRMKKIRGKKFLIESTCAHFHVDGITLPAPKEIRVEAHYQTLHVLVNK